MRTVKLEQLTTEEYENLHAAWKVSEQTRFKDFVLNLLMGGLTSFWNEYEPDLKERVAYETVQN